MWPIKLVYVENAENSQSKTDHCLKLKLIWIVPVKICYMSKNAEKVVLKTTLGQQEMN